MSSLRSDLENAKPRKEYPNGFALLADHIARDQDNTSSIYRRFDRLTARNLLHWQSRLQKLEAIQDELDEEVLFSNDKDCKRAASSWEDFESLAENREAERRRMAVAQEIHDTLMAYRES